MTPRRRHARSRLSPPSRPHPRSPEVCLPTEIRYSTQPGLEDDDRRHHTGWQPSRSLIAAPTHLSTGLPRFNAHSGAPRPPQTPSGFVLTALSKVTRRSTRLPRRLRPCAGSLPIESYRYSLTIRVAARSAVMDEQNASCDITASTRVQAC